jgi:hypothetical protein
VSCEALADRLIEGLISEDVGGRGGLSEAWVAVGVLTGILLSTFASAENG